MGECSSNQCCCPCHSNECCGDKHCGEGQYEDKEEFFLKIADEAWTEVLKEKIKEHILSTQKEKMTELAKIVSEGNNLRWKNKMEKKHCCMDFKEKLCRFFGQSKK